MVPSIPLVILKSGKIYFIYFLFKNRINQKIMGAKCNVRYSQSFFICLLKVASTNQLSSLCQ